MFEINANDIDCNIHCPTLFNMFNSCPSKHIDLKNLNIDQLEEIAYMLLSLSPYALSFVFLSCATYFKTTRAVLILMMCFMQNFIVEILKNALKDPRPNFKCNRQFGNPSNHAVFFSSLVFWNIMETILLDSKFRFKHTFIKALLFLAYPFILLSRIKLNYHSFHQILNGVFIGAFIGVFWFSICDNIFLKGENSFSSFLGRLGVQNNMSDYEIAGHGLDNKTYAKFMELSKKQDDLSKMKSGLKQFKSTIENMDIMNLDDRKKEYEEIMKLEEQLKAGADLNANQFPSFNPNQSSVNGVNKGNDKTKKSKQE